MTRRQTLKLQENGLREDQLYPLFPLFAEDTGIILSPVYIAVSPVLPLIV